MQRGRGERPPIGIALEGDLADRLDALMAIALLNGLFAKGEGRLISLSLSRPTLRGAQLVEAVSAFFTPRPRGGAGMIGMPEGAEPAAPPPLAAILDLPGVEGPRYPAQIETVIDTADNAVLIRNMLLAQHDGNAAIVEAGPVTGLVRLMNLYGARPQIEAKAARLVLALGRFDGRAEADPAVAADVAAMRTVLAEWPTPMVFVGREIGEALAYPAARFDADYGWTEAHPLVDAYKASPDAGSDVPLTAVAAVLHAVHPDSPFFTLSEPGTVTVDDDGTTSFAASPAGPHRHLIVNEARTADVLALVAELVAAPPAPRGRRGGPPPANQQQQQQQQQRPPQAPPAPPAAPPVGPPAPS